MKKILIAMFLIGVLFISGCIGNEVVKNKHIDFEILDAKWDGNGDVLDNAKVMLSVHSVEGRYACYVNTLDAKGGTSKGNINQAAVIVNTGTYVARSSPIDKNLVPYTLEVCCHSYGTPPLGETVCKSTHLR